MRQLKDLRQWGKMHGLVTDVVRYPKPRLRIPAVSWKNRFRRQVSFSFFIFDELGKIITMEKIWWRKKPGYVPKKFLETVPPLAGSS